MDDWRGFESVYRETSLPVLRFLRRRVPAELAEDALSEVYLTAWRRRGELRGEPLPFLYGIAKLVAANALRAAGRSWRLRELMAAEAETGDGHRPAAEQSAVDRISAAEALDRLPERDREALVLVAWDGLGVRQAAKVAGCGTAAFSVRLHRARRRLERLLDDDTAQDTGTGTGTKNANTGTGTGAGRGAGDERGHDSGEGAAVGARSGRRGGDGA
ncbi:RNA polymerase sigma factor [Streptomyces sp. NPDC020141]|uniref:RNA polymerase sigma factor n=1 Tax=Streptomyces sp. NPDC020141 TaxID=3365065 RepID=UPI00378E3F3E